MTEMKHRRVSVFAAIAWATLLSVWPGTVQAWWNDDWAYRKVLTIDTTTTGADIKSEATDVPVLVRLHTGNFSYFLDMVAGGADLRFVAGDDKTVLKHHVEKFDPVNEIGLIWVRVPRVAGGSKADTLYMYYGNPAATPAEDVAGSYDASQIVVYHFDGQDGAIRDKTSHANHPARSSAPPNPASLIGGGARFAGNGAITVASSATLKLDPKQGFTFSTWLKLDGPQTDAYVVHWQDGGQALVLGIQGVNLYARLQGGRAIDTGKQTTLKPGAWHHVALTAGEGWLRIYLDGAETASVEAVIPALAGTIALGASAQGDRFLTAEVDEVQMSNVVRPPAWIKAALGQGSGAMLLAYGEDGQRGGEGGGSYFGIILKNVTIDGWVIILLLLVMGVLSWAVMVGKGLLVARVRKDNQEFLRQFQALGAYKADDPDDTALARLFGAAFGSSTIYPLYHTGIQDVRHRAGHSVGAAQRGLNEHALNGVRAVLDAALVRQTQKLNEHMVLLTIAISGGPFLGLLGTVVGVMITFAAIAASGDVNVNAIAPGTAAALVATVAGLAVAIPALFGYNYLSSQIRDITADMRVFCDELMSRIAEHYSS